MNHGESAIILCRSVLAALFDVRSKISVSVNIAQRIQTKPIAIKYLKFDRIVFKLH